MTPLLGTKNRSAPVGDKLGGERRAARSLLPCALWRGMGRLWRGMGDPSRCFSVHDCSPLFTIVRHCSAKNITSEPVSPLRPHRQRGLYGFHETRDTNHGIYAFHESRDTKHGMYRRSVRHGSESVTSRKTSVRPPFPCVRTRGLARYRAAMARHGRPPSPTPATRPVGFSPATNHETWFSPVTAAIPRTATPSPTNRFFTNHETRNTNHGFYAFLPTISRHFPAFPGPPPPPLSDSRAPSAVLARPREERLSLEIPQKCTKSRIPQENARSTAFAADPVDLRACPAAANAT